MVASHVLSPAILSTILRHLGDAPLTSQDQVGSHQTTAEAMLGPSQDLGQSKPPRQPIPIQVRSNICLLLLAISPPCLSQATSEVNSGATQARGAVVDALEMIVRSTEDKDDGLKGPAEKALSAWI